MQLAPTHLTDHIKRGGIKPLYTLHGDEPLLVQEFADALRAAARAQGTPSAPSTPPLVRTSTGARYLPVAVR